MFQRRKKILVFIDWFLPGYRAGGPIRSVANLVDHLRDEFDFLIITRDRDYLSSEPYSDVLRGRWNALMPGVKVFYLTPEQTNARYIWRLVRETDFDLAYINGIYSFYFSILPVWLMRRAGKKAIVSARGMLSAHAFSRKSRKKNLFIAFARATGFYSRVCFHATAEAEKQEILRFFPGAKVFVIPNPTRRVDKYPFVERSKQQGSVRLVSIARISQEKNTLFALQVLSQVKTGQVVFDLYGSVYDKVYWDECQKVIRRMPSGVKVNYKGPVHTGEVIDVFSRYHFSFMPSRGENFGHSIFESLAAGTPVIISSNTPWRGLQDKGVGWDIDLADMQAFVRAIEQCIDMDSSRYKEMSRRAYDYARQYAKDDEVIARYKAMFGQCVREK